MRGGHQLDCAAQADGRVILAFNFAGTDKNGVAISRHDIHAVARVQQAHRAREAVCGRVQPNRFAAHAANLHRGVAAHGVASAHAPRINGVIKLQGSASGELDAAIGADVCGGFAPMPLRAVLAGAQVQGGKCSHGVDRTFAAQ